MHAYCLLLAGAVTVIPLEDKDERRNPGIGEGEAGAGLMRIRLG
jgi:hypothetical protein